MGRGAHSERSMGTSFTWPGPESAAAASRLSRAPSGPAVAGGAGNSDREHPSLTSAGASADGGMAAGGSDGTGGDHGTGGAGAGGAGAGGAGAGGAGVG